MTTFQPLPPSWDAMVTEMAFTLTTPTGTVHYVMNENTSMRPEGVGELVESITSAIWPKPRNQPSAHTGGDHCPICGGTCGCLAGENIGDAS